jgi:hypothetical protein
MDKTHIEADIEYTSRTECVTGETVVTTIEVDFEGILQEWLKNSRKVRNYDEYNQASDSPWAAPYNVRPIRGIEQRTTGPNGQGLSGQSGQKHVGVSVGEHLVVFEQSKFGKRPAKDSRKEMEIGGEGGSFIR